MNINSSPIVIETYNPQWPKKFSREAFMIRLMIARYTTAIEHIGSTAVPGLAAKPIIDILIGVKNLSDSPDFIPPLIRLGYIYIPEYEVDLPERRYLYKHRNGKSAFHLHMVETGSDFFKRHIAFREYLRSHPDAAAQYAELKLRLAKEYGSDRAGYTNAKTNFIQDIERKALTHEI
jgi:GrpB-like predicted nucleotidyltransferase (UPF0157 family)